MTEIHAEFQDNARKCYTVHINGIMLFFSYDTLIGVHTVTNYARVKNAWGPTTGRHFNQLGINDWPVVDYSELEKMVGDRLYQKALEQVNNRMNPQGGNTKCSKQE